MAPDPTPVRAAVGAPMTEPPDPKLVMQAHSLRARAVRTAVLHGSGRPRSERSAAALLWISTVLGLSAVGITVIAAKMAELLQHAGR